MNKNNLEHLLPNIKIDQKRKEQLNQYFQNAPSWIMNNITVEKIKKGKVLIREGEPVDVIYFIVDGLIKATDYRIYGIKFDFVLFTEVYAYGGMEVVMGLDKYRTSMQTVTDCIVLKIPKIQFAKWINSDFQALKHEAKLMGEYLLEQGRSVRAFLFLQGTDRLAMLFKNRYKNFAVNGVLELRNDRQELSDYTGLSVKTITRSLRKLKDEGMITKIGNRISINKDQYDRIKKSLSKILSEDL